MSVFLIFFHLKITNKIYELSTTITRYHICPELNVDFSQVGQTTVAIDGQGTFTVQVIDGVKDYADYMQTIFDFDKVFINAFNLN
jgi:phosphoglucomutase